MGKMEALSTRRPRGDVLPRSLAPIGICREESAAYVGVSPSKFDEMVADGRMPKPKKIDGRVVWAVERLTAAFNALPDEASGNPWDDEPCNSDSRMGRAS